LVVCYIYEYKSGKGEIAEQILSTIAQEYQKILYHPQNGVYL